MSITAIKSHLVGVWATAISLIGAIFVLLEAWKGLGWRTVLVTVSYCLWLAIALVAVPAIWKRPESLRLRLFAIGIVLFAGVLPSYWVYGLGTDYFLLPDSSPAFRLSALPYPRMLVALPSQERTLEYYAIRKCEVPSPKCTSIPTSPLNYSVILFREIDDFVTALTRSNLKPQIQFAASWLDDFKFNPDVAFQDKDVMVIGGPVSTGYFSLARDEIVKVLMPDGFQSLPIDFSNYVYSAAQSSDPYDGVARSAVVTRFGPSSNHRAIDEAESIAIACKTGDNYYAIAIQNRGSPSGPPCSGLGSKDDLAPPAIVAPRTHEPDREYEIDWGFFVRGPNPFAHRRRLLMAAGLHAEGSKCVLRYLLDLTSQKLDEVMQQAIDLHTDHGYLTGVLRCDREADGTIAPHLVRAAVF